VLKHQFDRQIKFLGKTVCLSCINEMKHNNYAIKCKMCSNEHRLPKTDDLPTNEILLILIDSAYSIESNNNGTKLVSIMKADEHTRKKTSLLLKEIDLNTEKLDVSIKNSRTNLTNYFDSIENDVNSRTDEIIGELNKSRDSIIKELNAHRKSAFEFFDQGLEENGNLLLKSKKNYENLIEESKSARCDSNSSLAEVSKLVKVATDFNQQIYQTLVYFENLVRNNLRFSKSNVRLDAGSLIGSLQFMKMSQPEQLALKSIRINETQSQTNLTHKFTSINYKIPLNVKNFFLIVLADKLILKATETAQVDDGFNYVMKLQIKDLEGGVISKSSENLNSNRIKRVQACNSNHFVAVLLKNRFLDNYTLMLFNNELMHVKSIELHYKPEELFMNDTGVYVKPFILHPSFIHKYNYKLDHIKSIGQCQDENRMFYFSKSFKLITFEKEKCFFIDFENFKLKIMNELNGRVLKSISLEETNNVLVQIDALNERINVLNTKFYQLNVYDWDGVFLFKKKIDSKIDSIDYFYLLNDENFSIVDKKNNFIHFF